MNEYKHDEITEDLTDVKKDTRFVCPKCNSENVKLRPMYGSVSHCKNCDYKWTNK